ncbi:MAG: hypothetical protein U0984_15730 [Prosthecobacter sp.]|nr:hypothetical protein [Prosthecobacter sp.]
MKRTWLICLLPVLNVCLSSCTESIAGPETKPPQESGAQFKEGHGIAVTEVMAEAIGLQTAEVLEETTAGATTLTIPQTALLTTVEGHFVYAKNGDHYLRTAVKIGAKVERKVRIADGLYAGDEVASGAVMSLWLAELQYLRGGKACACATD